MPRRRLIARLTPRLVVGIGALAGPALCLSAPHPPEEGQPAAVTQEIAGEIILESVSNRATVPRSARVTLTLPPPNASLPRGLRWGTQDGRSVPLEEIVLLRLGTETVSTSPHILYLRDGSALAGEIVGAPDGGGGKDNETVYFQGPLLGKKPLAIGLDPVQGLIVARAPATEGAKGAQAPVRRPGARLRNEVRRSSPPRDLLILLEEGRTEGVLEGLAPKGATFTAQRLGTVTVPFDKLKAIVLAALPGESPRTEPAVGEIRATLQDGSVLAGEIVKIAEDALTLRNQTLGEILLPLGSIVEVAFLGGRLSYLSDRDPTHVEEGFPAGFTANPLPFQRDASVMEGPLRMGGREYQKGLGVHARSSLEFPLTGGFTRFQATIGLDESARPTGSRITGAEGKVVFRVLLDGKSAFEKPMSWRDPPVNVDLPLGTGASLTLVVDCGNPDDPASVFNFALDRANWADARLVR